MPLPDVAARAAARGELARRALRAWRATSSTSSGRRWCPRTLLIGQLVDQLRPQLEELGDWEQVLELSRGHAGPGQRRGPRSAGPTAAAASSSTSSTRCSPPPRAGTPASEPPRPSRTTASCSRLPPAGGVRRGRQRGRHGAPALRLDVPGARPDRPARASWRPQSALHTEQRARGVTFRVGDGEPDRLFPLDLVPRIVTAEDWAGLTAGLDAAGARPGGVPARRLRRAADRRRRRGARPRVVDDAPGPSRLGKLVPAGRRADRGGRHRPGPRPRRPLAGAGGQPAGARRASATR